MLMPKRNFALTHFIAALLVAAILLCTGCAGGNSSTTPGFDSAGDSLPRKAIQGQGEKPVSVPDASPKEGGVPLYVHLWDGGSYDPDGEIVKWEWNFGDAAGGEQAWQDYTAREGDAWHLYSTPGARISLLRVTDNDGNKDVAHVQIELSEGNNANPIAVATTDPTSGDEPLTVSFSAAGSYDPDGSIVKYEWDFGAGAGYEDFTGTDGETSHEYAGGLYTAILRVTDDDGAESMDSVDIDVNSKPTAAACGVPTSGDEPLTVSFSAAGSNDPDGTIVMYEWNFGEGGGYEDFTGTDGAADYEYTTEGTYTAILRVTDDDGAQSTGSVEIEVIKSAVDDWRNCGHDPAHSGRSPFTGPTTNAVKWIGSLGSYGYMNSSQVIAADGTVYVATTDNVTGSPYNKLYAISSDGTVKWSYATGGAMRSSPAIGTDETIYVSSQDGNLYAINPDGILKWIFGTGMPIYTSPTVDLDGTIYLSSWNNFCAINPDGTLKWSHWIDTTTSSSPAIGPEGTIYVGSSRYGWLYAINPDGTDKWVHYTGAGISFRSSPAVAADGTIYIGSTIGLHAIDSYGSTKWVYATPSSISYPPAIAANGTVYLHCWGSLYAISPGGTQEWTYNIGGNYMPVIGGDGTIYVAYWLNLHAVNPDGTPKWNYTTDGWSFDGSAAIGVDGTIYAGASYRGRLGWLGDSRLYAIGPGEGI